MSKLGQELANPAGWEGMGTGITCAGHGRCQKGTVPLDTPVLPGGKERSSGMPEKAEQALPLP